MSEHPEPERARRAEAHDVVSLDELVARADLDELVRTADALTEGAQWQQLMSLRDKCRAALETGRQLWPIAVLAEHRLAACGPVELAARYAQVHSPFVAFGPLSEVVASRFPWREIAPHLTPGPARNVIAAERVLRGEDLRHEETLSDVEVPLALGEWEPCYALAAYGPSRIEHDQPPLPSLARVRLPTLVNPVDDQVVVEAVHDVVAPWTEQSNGRVSVAAVDGDALAAIAALGVRRARVGALTTATAMEQLLWAGAVGGAHGRRRGGARSRMAAFWLLTAIGGLDPSAPFDLDQLGDVAGGLRWWWWDANEPSTGWQLRMAVEDPTEGLAWAWAAVDQG